MVSFFLHVILLTNKEYIQFHFISSFAKCDPVHLLCPLKPERMVDLLPYYFVILLY